MSVKELTVKKMTLKCNMYVKVPALNEINLLYLVYCIFGLQIKLGTKICIIEINQEL